VYERPRRIQRRPFWREKSGKRILIYGSETSPNLQRAVQAVRFATASSFKELEADAIVFFGIDDLETTENAGSLCVGASRAKAVLTLIVDARAKLGYKRRAAEFGKRLATMFFRPFPSVRGVGAPAGLFDAGSPPGTARTLGLGRRS
jgi:hypothetical protein